MVTDARLHFHALRGAGWSLRSIAAHVGASPSTVTQYVNGADLPHVERGLLAIEPGTLATRTTPLRAGQQAEPFVPRVGTVRRLRALMRIGWPSAEINARLQALGITDKRAAENLLNAPGRWVTRSRHDAVAAVYRDLSRVSGPSDRCRRRAEKAGYPGPTEWDDIDHDEAPAKPEEFCQTDECLNTAQWTYDPTRTGDEALLCRRHADEQRAAS